jgi:nitrous oxide reductase accessory protein NosL
MTDQKQQTAEKQGLHGTILIVCAAAALLMMPAFAKPVPASAGKPYTQPADRDKCPVCGMFVAKYPDWIAEAVFRDSAYAVFDGPKDLFKYLANLKKYAQGRSEPDIEVLYVMDYYTVKPIDAHTAYYVIGSDVFGPMGAELIPFEKEADAREFLKDHQGKRILRFKEITHDVLKGLE